MKILIALIVLTCFSCATWTREEKAKEVCWMLLHFIDYKQTQYAMDRPGEFKELNPLLGDSPSEGRLNTCTAVGGLAHFLTTHYFPEYRAPWQNTTLGLKAVVVGNNFYVGARVEF